MGKRCPYCRQIIADESLFCPECGKEFPIGRTCSFCGGAISDDDVFCPNCGVVVAKGKACPHCRAAINESDLFCSNCGAKIDIDEKNSHSDHEEVKAEERTDSPKVVEVQPQKPIAPSPPPTESEHEVGASDDLEELKDTSPKKYGKWIIISVIVLALIGGGVFFLLNRSSNKWESKGEIVTNGSRMLYGTIGELPITMELHIEASKVDGSMYYNKYGPSNKLFVSGSMHHNEIELTEHNNDGMETGRYKGKYSNGVFQGEYINYKGDTYPFSLSETEEGNKEMIESKDISAGLTFRTFTKESTVGSFNDVDDRTYRVQLCLENKEIADNLLNIGFVLMDSQTTMRPGYADDDDYEVTIETYSKTINEKTTTVKLEEYFTEIHFPNLNDVEEFKESAISAGMSCRGERYVDNEEVSWAGTDMTIKGTIVTLSYRWIP